MAETEVKIRIRLELDEGDKVQIKNQAKAIAETGTSPLQSQITEQKFGIFAGERTDTVGATGFEQNKRNIRTPFKDTKSRAPFQREDPFSDLKSRLENLEETITTPEQMKKLLGFDPTDFKTLKNLAQNPETFLLKFIGTIGLPIAVVSTIISSPQLVQQLVEFLTQRGGLFDKFFKRNILDERNPFFSRERQKQRQLGESSVIISQTRGFGTSSGSLTTNTLAQVRANGISDIGMRDKSGGLF